MANGTFGGGNGTDLAPYFVEDGEDLKAIMTLEGSSGMYFVQVSNIDLSNYKSEIYNLNVKSYNGGGFQISNLEINEANITDTTGITSLSLFRLSSAGSSLLDINLVDALIKTVNLMITSSLVTPVGTGALVSNCHVSGSVSSFYNYGLTGGLASISANNCIFKDSSFSGIVTGSSGVSSFDYGTGGFIGRSSIGTVFENCSSSGDVVGVGCCGGFVGYGSTDNQMYRGCHAMCNVSASNNASGGFAGYLGGKDTLVTSCRVDNGTADLVGLKIVSNSSTVGGFVGRITGSTGKACTIRYVSSVVSSVTGTTNVGGFVGDCSTATIHDVECYGGYVLGTTSVGGFAGNTYSAPILTNIISRGVQVEGLSIVGGLTGSNASTSKYSWCYVYYTRIIRTQGTATSFYDLCNFWDICDQVEGGSGFVVDYLGFYDRA